MLWKLLTVSLVVMGLSHTIARERLFARVRRALGGHDTWLGYLVSCPYCVSHWVAFLLVPLTGTYAIEVVPHWGPVSWVLRWLLSSVLVTAIAAFFRVAFYFVDETQGLVRRQQKTVDAQTETVRAAHERLVDAQDSRESQQSQQSDDGSADARH